MTLAVVILAAGQGTRMQSKKQKILHEVGGRSMVEHAFRAAESIADLSPVLVVAPGDSAVPALLGDAATYVTQPEPLGTGHATRQAAEVLNNKSEQVLVTYADMPLLRSATMARLAERQRETGAAVVMLVVTGDETSTFGRLVRDDNGQVVEIVEVAEARRRPNCNELLAITELNAGVYCFDSPWLWANIDKLPERQARGGREFYLTDMIELAVQQGRLVETVTLADPVEGLGAGTRAELVAVEAAFRQRTADYWLNHGVTLIDPATTYIDSDVAIGADTVIWPNTYLQGTTSIGEDCIIGPMVIVRNTTIGNGCRVEHVVVENAAVPDGATLRASSRLSIAPPPTGSKPNG